MPVGHAGTPPPGSSPGPGPGPGPGSASGPGVSGGERHSVPRAALPGGRSALVVTCTAVYTSATPASFHETHAVDCRSASTIRCDDRLIRRPSPSYARGWSADIRLGLKGLRCNDSEPPHGAATPTGHGAVSAP